MIKNLMYLAFWRKCVNSFNFLWKIIWKWGEESNKGYGLIQIFTAHFHHFLSQPNLFHVACWAFWDNQPANQDATWKTCTYGHPFYLKTQETHWQSIQIVYCWISISAQAHARNLLKWDRKPNSNKLKLAEKLVDSKPVITTKQSLIGTKY